MRNPCVGAGVPRRPAHACNRTTFKRRPATARSKPDSFMKRLSSSQYRPHKAPSAKAFAHHLDEFLFTFIPSIRYIPATILLINRTTNVFALRATVHESDIGQPHIL
jgi:hypothetical protein